MKKRIIIMLALLCVSITSVYADTTVSGTTPTMQPDHKPTVAKIDTNKAAEQKSDQDSSFYDSVRSGWNKFIDFLAGPAK